MRQIKPLRYCTQSSIVMQTLSCPQQKPLDCQDSSACYSSRSQPSPFTHADSTHYDDDNAADKHAPFNQAEAAEGFTKQVSRKVGRPVTFQGDINSPTLTSSERSRLKRRVVNRAAARRLRERQQDTLDGAHLKVTHLRQRKQKLQEDIQAKRAQHDNLQGELAEAQTESRQAQADYGRLQAEVKSMRHSLEMELLMMRRSQASHPQLLGNAAYWFPTLLSRDSPSCLSHEVVEPMPLAACSPSFTARESLPSVWKSALAGQVPQGSLGPSPSSSGRTSCLTGSAGGNATLRDLLIDQSCREAASGCYASDLGATAACSPSLSAGITVQPSSKPGQFNGCDITLPHQYLTHPPPFFRTPLHTADPFFWNHNLNGLCS